MANPTAKISVIFEKLIYPKAEVNNYGSITGFMIGIFTPTEEIETGGKPMYSIKCVGKNLPIQPKLKYELTGEWEITKYGPQFNVKSWEQSLEQEKEGIIGYLSSGQIKGCGVKTAEKIYEMFGDNTFKVLDESPEKLLKVNGISAKKLEVIKNSYIETVSARNLIAFLAQHGISSKMALRLHKRYGSNALDVLNKHPYTLCEIKGIGFKTADKIATSIGVGKMSQERFDAAILFVLESAKGEGHICLPKNMLISKTLKILETAEITKDMMISTIKKLETENRIVSFEGNEYLKSQYDCEQTLSYLAYKYAISEHKYKCVDLDECISRKQEELGLSLADEQISAVKCALKNSFSIITGGPGTGKSTISKLIIDIYLDQHPNAEIALAAPTGIAARRLASATGRTASTIHRLLNLQADDEGELDYGTRLKADFVMIDEVSMVDESLAERLFESLKEGGQIVLVGDDEQLPSVGPGAVLRELLASGMIEYVKLDKIFRQAAGSKIATNSRLIKYGNVNLEDGADFKYIYSPDLATSKEKILQIYEEEANRIGADNIALLSPRRKGIDACVNDINPLLRDKINPPAPNKREATTSTGRLFREGDRIMSLQNHGTISNGETGVITKIITDSDNLTTITIDYNGIKKEYELGDMDIIDLGYAATVHKSQGLEYSTVIIHMQTAHSIMLTRAILYTAVTRGKKKVIIVGEKKAICMAIRNNQTAARYTALGTRVRGWFEKKYAAEIAAIEARLYGISSLIDK